MQINRLQNTTKESLSCGANSVGKVLEDAQNLSYRDQEHTSNEIIAENRSVAEIEPSSSSSSTKLDSSSSFPDKSFKIMKQNISPSSISIGIRGILRKWEIQWNGWILRSSFAQESTQQALSRISEHADVRISHDSSMHQSVRYLDQEDYKWMCLVVMMRHLIVRSWMLTHGQRQQFQAQRSAQFQAQRSALQVLFSMSDRWWQRKSYHSLKVISCQPGLYSYSYPTTPPLAKTAPGNRFQVVSGSLSNSWLLRISFFQLLPIPL